jgi:hypothetical protein
MNAANPSALTKILHLILFEQEERASSYKPQAASYNQG